jgi:hypothetical protein
MMMLDTLPIWHVWVRVLLITVSCRVGCMYTIMCTYIGTALLHSTLSSFSNVINPHVGLHSFYISY